jgi:cytoskeletal protein CcmA (bactofilin family)
MVRQISLKEGMTMGLFNNETDKKAGPERLAVMPESMPAQAVPEAQSTRPDASRAPMAHQITHARTAAARAYLDQGSKISGKLQFEGPAQIEGQVDGEISAKDSLTIGESAVVTAQIKASSIVVAGKLSGEIIASQRIEIRPSAKVSGNLTTPRLVVHDGAIFEGNCNMQSEGVRQDAKTSTLRKEEPVPVQTNTQNHP